MSTRSIIYGDLSTIKNILVDCTVCAVICVSAIFVLSPNASVHMSYNSENIFTESLSHLVRLKYSHLVKLFVPLFYIFLRFNNIAKIVFEGGGLMRDYDMSINRRRTVAAGINAENSTSDIYWGNYDTIASAIY